MSNLELTKREKIVLAVIVILMAVLYFISPISNGTEYCLTILIVTPLGFYIATDRERKNKQE